MQVVKYIGQLISFEEITNQFTIFKSRVKVRFIQIMASKFLFRFLVGITVILSFNLFARGIDKGDFFSAQEKSALDKFRPLLGEYQVQDYMKTDLYLLRWLKAGKFDIEASVDMMKKSNKWRKENKIEEHIHEDLKAHYKHLPYSIDKVDRKGHPILYFEFGKWPMRKYALAGKTNFLIRYWWQMMEKLEQKVHDIATRTGKPISQFYFLDNMDGYSLTQHACLQCLPVYATILRTFDPHHPYFAYKAIFINMPRIALPFLTIVKEALCGQPSLDIFKSYSYDKTEWESVLLEDIAPDQLSPSLGVKEKE